MTDREALTEKIMHILRLQSEKQATPGYDMASITTAHMVGIMDIIESETAAAYAKGRDDEGNRFYGYALDREASSESQESIDFWQRSQYWLQALKEKP